MIKWSFVRVKLRLPKFDLIVPTGGLSNCNWCDHGWGWEENGLSRCNRKTQSGLRYIWNHKFPKIA